MILGKNCVSLLKNRLILRMDHVNRCNESCDSR